MHEWGSSLNILPEIIHLFRGRTYVEPRSPLSQLSALEAECNKARKGNFKLERKRIKGASSRAVNVAVVLHMCEKGEQGSFCRDIKKKNKDWKVTQEITLQKDEAISLFLFSFFTLFL